MTTAFYQPGTLDLRLYSGDGFAMPLNFKTYAEGGSPEDGVPIPLTGTWTAQIRGQCGVLQTEFAIDTTAAAEGTLVLSLTGAQTAALEDGLWDLQEELGPEPSMWEGVASPRTWVRGTITVTSDVTHSEPPEPPEPEPPPVDEEGYGLGRYGFGPYGDPA